MNLIENLKKYSKTDRTAFVYKGEKLSYNDLNSNSDAFAAYIMEKLSDEKRPVLIYGNKENEFPSLMFGATKSGRAYIPVDISFPLDRLYVIIEESKPELLINLTETELEGNFLNREDIQEIFKNYRGKEIDENQVCKGNDDVYILFTSGSTGKPKGVRISADNLESFTDWFSEYSKETDKEANMLNCVSYSFDLSVAPLYIGLNNGKTLKSIGKKEMESAVSAFEEIRKSEIETFVATPSLCEILLSFDDFNGEVLSKLKRFVFSGEVLPVSVAARLMKRFKNARIINGYGPTEGTVFISASTVDEEMVNSSKPLHVGHIMTGARLRIVDSEIRDVKDGEKGEIIISGKSISKGYLNNKEQTEKAFFEDTETGFRGYRTGDIGYLDENGFINFMGRKDFQVKLHGYRIELEDIENNIRKVDNVASVAVLPVYKDDKVNALKAFITLSKKNDLSNLKNAAIIKSELKKYIPEYMVPKFMVFMDELPRNNNGKLDRKKLKELL